MPLTQGSFYAHSTGQEREHFNKLSTERHQHGFIPDLDRMEDCDFFYLSPFRRRHLANLTLKRMSFFFIDKLQSVLPVGARVLDLGCGNGWFSLELAKAGFQVTAVDLSDASIALARETLCGSPPGHLRGTVSYHCADLNTWNVDRADYAAVCYVGSLHHLHDPAAVVKRVCADLPDDHFMVAAEPLPGNYGPAEAAVAALIRVLLSAREAWFEPIPIPDSPHAYLQLLDEVRNEYANWADKNESRQSPMNNSTDGKDNLALLKKFYDVTATQDHYPLNHRLIGGIRLSTDEENLRLAKFVARIEDTLMATGALKPGGFNIVGKSRQMRSN